MPEIQEVTVLAATGNVGRRLVRHLVAAGVAVRAIGRDRARLAAACQGLQTGGVRAIDVEQRIADIYDPVALAQALAGSKVVVSCTDPMSVETIVSALPASVSRFVMLGSTRKFTEFPDPLAEQVVRAEHLLATASRPSPEPGGRSSGRTCLILHPTMIYGAGNYGAGNIGGATEDIVGRILGFVGRFAVVPLPKAGRALVQPIHVDDVVASLAAAALLPNLDPAPIVIAGAQALTYENLVRTCARAVGRKVWIAPAPVWLLLAVCGLGERFGVKPPLGKPEILRLTEDKAFAIDDMVARLGVHPVSFEVGLGKMLAAGQESIG
jgi:uncharacterized protein YbjT (DUF2867 family)